MAKRQTKKQNDKQRELSCNTIAKNYNTSYVLTLRQKLILKLNLSQYIFSLLGKEFQCVMLISGGIKYYIRPFINSWNIMLMQRINTFLFLK